MVRDVAEVAQQPRVHLLERAVLHGIKQDEQRVHGAIEVVDLLLELVDALGRIDVPGEDRLLDRLDVDLKLLDDRLIVIDDPVENPPHHSRRAALE